MQLTGHHEASKYPIGSDLVRFVVDRDGVLALRCVKVN